MAYLTNLRWVKNLADFDPEQQKVLLALSHDQYKWRSRDHLLSLTRLESKELDNVLSELIDEDVIRPSFSKKRNIIFGIRERVG